MAEVKLKLIEKPKDNKIVEARELPGKLKVVGAWYLWQGFFTVAIKVVLAILNIEIPKGNYPDITLVLGIIIAIIFMQYRMNTNARERWRQKYNKQ
ncbi:hypothetical protein LC609_33540 [Nostoc sp. XA013]|nr:hypothetical protein [Nostoc sp. XA013]